MPTVFGYLGETTGLEAILIILCTGVASLSIFGFMVYLAFKVVPQPKQREEEPRADDSDDCTTDRPT